jgi:flagellar biosynthesis protein FlhG
MAVQTDPSTILLEAGVLEKRLWAVAGGKGGTGKTVLTANIGVGLSILGYKVILIDGDLGAPDLHFLFGISNPIRNLNDFLMGRVESLGEVILETPNENLRLICGGSEIVGLANLPFQRKERLRRHIAQIDADYVIVDLGAGTAYNTLDFFIMSNEGIVVANPEPHAKIDAYAFVKSAIYRRLMRIFADSREIQGVIAAFSQAGGKALKIRDLIRALKDKGRETGALAEKAVADFRPRFIMNRVRRKAHVEDARRFVDLVRDYLGVDMLYAGHVDEDARVLEACERMRPFLIEHPKCTAAADLYAILFGLGAQDRRLRFDGRSSRKMARSVQVEAKRWGE